MMVKAPPQANHQSSGGNFKLLYSDEIITGNANMINFEVRRYGYFAMIDLLGPCVCKTRVSGLFAAFFEISVS